MTVNAVECVGTHDIVFITLDTLRLDVARKALADGLTPNIASILPDSEWEERHTPGSFTYAAHHAFFAGFLPTPVNTHNHRRLFAAQFPGSETTGDGTFVFQEPDIVSGLSAQGYHTICIGGVGFFNKASALGSVLPALFDESVWDEKLGVTEPQSTQYQVQAALDCIGKQPEDRRLFLFMNVSACHQPNRFYIEGAEEDNQATQQAALSYVDSQLPPLFEAMRKRGPVLLIICSDHGTSYGDDGYTGHRIGHPVVWTVPYMETILPSGRDV